MARRTSNKLRHGHPHPHNPSSPNPNHHKRQPSKKLHYSSNPIHKIPNPPTPVHKPHNSSAAALLPENTHPQTPVAKRPTFASYLDTPDLPPKIRLLCEILAKTHTISVEERLEKTGVRVTQKDVEEVLKLSYGFPGLSVKFFRWAGRQLNNLHSPYAWNLVVDLLGKNCFFDAMWDAISAMAKERLALDECVKKGNARGADTLWRAMIGRIGFRPDTNMYNAVISLHCHDGNVDLAKRMFDEMVYNGAFPNSQIYNMVFKFLIKDRKLKQASALFTEMVKNECVPELANCGTAVRIFLDSEDPYFAIKLWKCMMENYHSGLEDTGNLLVVRLRDLNRVPEAVKYAEDMIARRIKLEFSTLSKLKQNLFQARKENVYDELLRKWKAQ